MIAPRLAMLALLAGTIAAGTAAAPAPTGTDDAVLDGWATAYGCPGTGEYFHGAPLYCNNGVNGLVYDGELPPWVAVDVSEYESGNIRCGDLLLACTGRNCVLARAWDAGYLYYDRRTGKPWGRLGGRHVVVDLPYHLNRELGWTGMDRVTVTNISKLERDMAQVDSREGVR